MKIEVIKNGVPEHYYKKCFKVMPIVVKFIETKPTIHPDVFTFTNMMHFKHRINLN